MREKYKKFRLWKHTSLSEWNDWKWQLANRVTTVEKLQSIVTLTEEEKTEIQNCLKSLRMAITPYYATLMDPRSPACPIRKQAIPTAMD